LSKDHGLHQLVPHPGAPHPVISIEVGVKEFGSEGMEYQEERDFVYLEFSYRVRGNVTALSLPPFDGERPQKGDRLWEHTCFEAFCRHVGSDAYYEANIAPSRRWAFYQFDTYRSGMRSIFPAMPRIFTLKVEGGYGLIASLIIPVLPPVKLALSAVIEETNGTKSYWALAHPPGAPDFHHADCFALTLPAFGAA
jgi:hypothetical protein